MFIYYTLDLLPVKYENAQIDGRFSPGDRGSPGFNTVAIILLEEIPGRRPQTVISSTPSPIG
jgi:hypothetical protein